MHQNTRVKLTISGDTVINYEIVSLQYQRKLFETFDSLPEFQKFCTSNNIRLEKGTKIGIGHTFDGLLKEISIVPFDHANPIEYIFHSPEEAEEFSKKQGLKPSVYLASEDAKGLISHFLKGEPCTFEGYEDLYKKYQNEVEAAGGADCPQCTKAAIIRKYQQLVWDIIGDKESNNKEQKQIETETK